MQTENAGHRSKNHRNGGSKCRTKTIAHCVKCHGKIPTVFDVVANIGLPSDICKIVSSFVSREPHTGYVPLHKSRRRRHVVCLSCYNRLSNESIQAGNNCFDCPANCNVWVRVNIQRNYVI